MRGFKILVVVFCLSGLSFSSSAQIDTDKMDSIESAKKILKRGKTTNNAVLISPYYTVLFPVGELSRRFGVSNDAGLNISFKVPKNFLIGIEGAYLFGRKVKEYPLSNMLTTTTSPGQIIGQDGSLNDIPVQLSGFEIALRVGKLIPVMKKHPNSGIEVSLAPGFIQHKILINANANTIPQLNSTYLQGYDRMTNGPMIAGNIGFLYLEKKKFLSFYGGFDFAAGFTQERRDWNFDLMSADTHHRIDMLIGIKLAWIIPVFTNRDSEVYYY